MTAEPQNPGHERNEAMRKLGLLACPSWCAQTPDEAEHEEHAGEWRTVTTDDGDEVRVRPRLSWYNDVDGDPHTEYVEVDIVRDDASVGAYLTLALAAGLRDLLDEAETDLADAWDEEKWAYPGAEEDSKVSR